MHQFDFKFTLKEGITMQATARYNSIFIMLISLLGAACGSQAKNDLLQTGSSSDAKAAVGKSLAVASALGDSQFLKFEEKGDLRALNLNGQGFIVTAGGMPSAIVAPTIEAVRASFGNAKIVLISDGLYGTVENDVVGIAKVNGDKATHFKATARGPQTLIGVGESSFIAKDDKGLNVYFLDGESIHMIEAKVPGSAAVLAAGEIKPRELYWYYSNSKFTIYDVKTKSNRSSGLSSPPGTGEFVAAAIAPSKDKPSDLSVASAIVVLGKTNLIGFGVKEGSGAPVDTTKPVEKALSFDADIAPIAKNYCTGCHSAGSGRKFIDAEKLESWKTNKDSLIALITSGAMPKFTELPAADKQKLLDFLKGPMNASTTTTMPAVDTKPGVMTPVDPNAMVPKPVVVMPVPVVVKPMPVVDPAPKPVVTLTFDADVKPLAQMFCAACHGGTNHIFKNSDLEASWKGMKATIASEISSGSMPKDKPITAAQKKTLLDWLAQP